MLARARHFAEAYQQATDKRSLLAHGAVRHPSLFVFIGRDGDGVFTKIEAAAARAQSAFFLYAADESSVRAAKAEIQRNDAGLNLKRVNISIIVPAYEREALDFPQAGQTIRGVFEEDIAVVHTTLFLLLSESNAAADYKQRAANCHAALKRAEECPCNRVFVLSDRNEKDAVSEANMENYAGLIAHLPRLLNTDSRFDENMMKKSLDANQSEAGTFFLSTAGMARLEKPSYHIAFTAYKSVAEKALALYESITDENAGQDEDWHIPLHREGAAAPPLVADAAQITAQMRSLAARPVSAGKLRGKTLGEAEAMIYGTGAERFFAANYAKNPEEISACLPADLPRPACEKTLNALNAVITEWDAKLAEARARVCKPALFGGADEIKRMVAETYVYKQKLYVYGILKTRLEALAKASAEREKHVRRFMGELSLAMKELDAVPDPGGHIRAFYGKAADEIFLRHKQAFGGGTLPLDMDAFAQAVEAFIQEYVWTDESFQLSFDGDLRKRSLSVDDGFLNAEDFYRQTIEALDAQSALAVSLIRYDDLYREKFYFGAANSPLMAYAKQSREAVYCVEEPNGFAVIRLAGGFAARDLTRYKVMEEAARATLP